MFDSDKKNAGCAVTIVINAYNNGPYLQEAVDSALAQKYDNFRVVVIDDKSTDDTGLLLEKYKQKPNFELITNEQNIGKPASLNSLLPSLADPYVVLMDGDDAMYPNRLSRQVEFMQAHPEIGASSGFMHYINQDGDIIGRAVSDLLSVDAALDYEARNEPFAICSSCAILRTEIFKDSGLLYRPQFWPADDIDLWNRIYEKGWAVTVQPEVLTKYRVHGASAITSNFYVSRKQFEYVRACMRARRAGQAEPSAEEFDDSLKARSIWEKLNNARKTLAFALYRAGGFAYGEKKYFHMVCRMFVAAMMAPRYVVKRLVQQRGSYRDTT